MAQIKLPQIGPAAADLVGLRLQFIGALQNIIDQINANAGVAGSRLTGVGHPAAPTDAATKKYVDDAIAKLT